MRTQEQIQKRAQASTSVFGFDTEVFIAYLDFEHAKPMLKPDADSAKWTWSEPNRDNVLVDMREYMAFAWGKVEDHRGISAGRSVEKMRAWIWLLEDEGFLDELEKVEYAQYGAPILKTVCERYGFVVPSDEATQRMTRGEPCTPDCEQGCAVSEPPSPSDPIVSPAGDIEVQVVGIGGAGFDATLNAALGADGGPDDGGCE